MPREVHEHFDADGKLTGTTVVTRESAWDDESRGRALRLAEYEDSLCGCGCGQPVAVSQNKEQAWSVDTYTCGARRAIQKVTRMKAEEAKRLNLPEGHDDGVHYYAVPMDDDRPEKQPRARGASGD